MTIAIGGQRFRTGNKLRRPTSRHSGENTEHTALWVQTEFYSERWDFRGCVPKTIGVQIAEWRLLQHSAG
jgi:hypothetical protein